MLLVLQVPSFAFRGPCSCIYRPFLLRLQVPSFGFTDICIQGLQASSLGAISWSYAQGPSHLGLQGTPNALPSLSDLLVFFILFFLFLILHDYPFLPLPFLNPRLLLLLFLILFPLSLPSHISSSSSLTPLLFPLPPSSPFPDRHKFTQNQ